MKDVVRLCWRERVSESGPWEEHQHDFDTYRELDAWWIAYRDDTPSGTIRQVAVTEVVVQQEQPEQTEPPST